MAIILERKTKVKSTFRSIDKADVYPLCLILLSAVSFASMPFLIVFIIRAMFTTFVFIFSLNNEFKTK